jgi:hypothetical protein
MDNATALSLARIAAGAGAWATPELGLKVAMLDPTAPQAPYLMRLFGVRDLALGAVTLLASPDHKPALLKLGLLVDAADAAAGVMAYRAGAVKPPTGFALTAMALSGVLAGVVALGQQKKAV